MITEWNLVFLLSQIASFFPQIPKDWKIPTGIVHLGTKAIKTIYSKKVQEVLAKAANTKLYEPFLKKFIEQALIKAEVSYIHTLNIKKSNQISLKTAFSLCFYGL